MSTTSGFKIDDSLEFREIQLFRVNGAFVDSEGISWFRNGQRDPNGNAVYTDGLYLAIRSGNTKHAKDVTATELG